MKKLMVAAFAVAFAAVAQAATVTWSANTIPQSGTSTSYYAILVDVGASAFTTVADVAKALQDNSFDGTIMWQGAAVFKSPQVVVAANKQTLPDEYVPNQEVTYMSIVFDSDSIASAENYYSTTLSESAKTGKISDAGALPLQQGNVSGGTWVAVTPEPTTGLLMLIGMAGLALRRRRA